MKEGNRYGKPLSVTIVFNVRLKTGIRLLGSPSHRHSDKYEILGDCRWFDQPNSGRMSTGHCFNVRERINSLSFFFALAFLQIDQQSVMISNRDVVLKFWLCMYKKKHGKRTEQAYAEFKLTLGYIFIRNRLVVHFVGWEV